MAISLKEAHQFNLPNKPKRARSARNSAVWTKRALAEYHEHGWHLGIARRSEGVTMVDMVVAWKDGKAGVQELVEWETFKGWTVEQMREALKKLEKQG